MSNVAIIWPGIAVILLSVSNIITKEGLSELETKIEMIEQSPILQYETAKLERKLCNE